jgi:hypothetical protein
MLRSRRHSQSGSDELVIFWGAGSKQSETIMLRSRRHSQSEYDEFVRLWGAGFLN